MGNTGRHSCIIFLLVMCLCFNTSVHSQSLADTIKSEVSAINHAYDSAFYLTFNVSMEYQSDTLWAGTDSADFNYSAVKGSYTFHRNKALYKLGDITYLKNDSFTIAAYDEQKFLLVGKVVPGVQTGSFLPTRTLVDSMTSQLVQQYALAFSQSDSINTISMTALDSNAAYTYIRMEYEPATHYLLKVSFRMKDYGYVESSTAPGPDIIRKAEMTIRFSQYRVSRTSADVFSETQFIFFDGPGIIRPADKYRDYTVYKNY